MTHIAVIAGLLILCAIVGIVWFRKNKAQRLEKSKKIIYLLDRVDEAASKRKTQLYQSLDGQDNQVLNLLKEAAQSSPINITAELEEIDALWLKLSQEVGEFSNQSVQSTLRSSVVTSHAAQTSTQISKLVAAIKAKLAG